MRLRAKWSGKCVPEVELPFYFSRLLCCAVVTAYACTIALLWVMLDPVTAALLSVFALAGIFTCRNMPALGWSGRTLVRVSWHQDGSWTLLERCGRQIEARLDGVIFHGNLLIQLRWRTAAQRSRDALLMPDCSTEEALRRMRYMLKCAVAMSDASGPAPSAVRPDAARMRSFIKNKP